MSSNSDGKGSSGAPSAPNQHWSSTAAGLNVNGGFPFSGVGMMRGSLLGPSVLQQQRQIIHQQQQQQQQQQLLSSYKLELAQQQQQQQIVLHQQILLQNNQQIMRQLQQNQRQNVIGNAAPLIQAHGMPLAAAAAGYMYPMMPPAVMMNPTAFLPRQQMMMMMPPTNMNTNRNMNLFGPNNLPTGMLPPQHNPTAQSQKPPPAASRKKPPPPRKRAAGKVFKKRATPGMNGAKKLLMEISKGRNVPANTEQLLSIVTKWPKVTLLEKPTDLLQMWQPLIRAIYNNSSSQTELMKAAFYCEKHPYGPNLVFSSERGRVAELNGVQRWNSLGIFNCDLEDPNFLELLAGMGELVAAPLHELQIKSGRSYCNSPFRWFTWDENHKKCFGDTNNKEATPASKESMTRCLVTLLQSIKGLRVIEIENGLGVNPEPFQVDWVAVVEALNQSECKVELHTITVEPSQKEEPAPQDVAAWTHHLQHHNRTLERVPGMSLGKDETVKHYMYLNRMGRAKAVNSCGEELVALLCPPRTVDRKKRTNLNRCNLIYGLLREAPGMWAKYYNSAGISICSTSMDPPKKKKSSKRKKTSAAVPTRSLPRRKTRSNT